MNSQNPYETASTRNCNNAIARMPRSSSRWIGTGFILAAVGPIAFGAYGLYRESVYIASLPPGTAACGMGSLAAMMFIFVCGPVCGIIGGFVGWIGTKIWPLNRRLDTDEA